MRANLNLFFLAVFLAAAWIGWGWPDIAKIMPVYVAAIPGLLLVLVQLYRDATQWDRRRAKEAEASRWMRSMMSSWIRRSSSGAR